MKSLLLLLIGCFSAMAQPTITGSGTISGLGSISLGTYPPPIANFTQTTNVYYAGGATNITIPTGQINYTDNSTVSSASAPHTYSWTCIRSDGVLEFTSALQNPTHVFNTGGTYTVSETVSDLGGASTAYGTTKICIPVDGIVSMDGTSAGQPVTLAQLYAATVTNGVTLSWTQNTNGEAPCNIYPIVGVAGGLAPPTPLYLNSTITNPTPTTAWQVRFVGTAANNAAPNGGTNGFFTMVFANQTTTSNLSLCFWWTPKYVIGAGSQFDIGQMDTPTLGDTNSSSWNTRDNPLSIGMEGDDGGSGYFGPHNAFANSTTYLVQIWRCQTNATIECFSTTLTSQGQSSVAHLSNPPGLSLSDTSIGEDNQFISGAGTNVISCLYFTTNVTVATQKLRMF